MRETLEWAALVYSIIRVQTAILGTCRNTQHWHAKSAPKHYLRIQSAVGPVACTSLHRGHFRIHAYQPMKSAFRRCYELQTLAINQADWFQCREMTQSELMPNRFTIQAINAQSDGQTTTSNAAQMGRAVLNGPIERSVMGNTDGR